jgi:hypothetical protein
VFRQSIPTEPVWGALCLSLAGCASAQVNYNTLDIAGTYDQLITKQVTLNLQKSIDSKWSLPAFVKVTAQSAGTVNSITPMVTLPISGSIQQLSSLQKVATATTTQYSRTGQFAGQGISLGGSDQWNQTYTLTPVIDTGSLRRLRVLYQFATRQIDSGDFESTYPIIEVGSAGSSAGSSKTTTKLTITVDGKPVTVTQETGTSAGADGNAIAYVRRTFLPPNPDGSFSGYTWRVVKPDTTFIEQPGCILCDYGDILPSIESRKLGIKEGTKVHILVKNYDLRNDWLYLPNDSIPTDAAPLPAGIGRSLYVANSINGTPGEGLRLFYEFALFSEDASELGTGSASSGGQSLGRKTAPIQRISIPVAGGSTTLPQ